MKRIDTANVEPDKFGTDKPGFRNGDPLAGTPATSLNASFFDNIQEEVCRAVEKSGIELDGQVFDQLTQAILRITSTQVTTITADTTLGLGHAGLVNVDASGGNVTLTLPPASTLPGLRYTILRTDSSGNSVTIAPDSGNPDTVIGEASLSLDEGDAYELRADGQSDWVNLLEPRLDAIFSAQNDLNSPGYQIFPGGLIMQWGVINLDGNQVKSQSYPIAFPTHGIRGWITRSSSQPQLVERLVASMGDLTTTAFTACSSSDSSGSSDSFAWLVIGK